MAPKNKSVKNFDLSTLSQSVRNSPLYKRMNDMQRKLYYGTLVHIFPCHENSVNPDFHVPGIKELYTYRNWEKWLQCEGGYCRASVMEFLATMKVIHDPSYHDEDRDFGVEAMVNGKSVVISDKGFNEYYECALPKREPGDRRVEYQEFITENKAALKEIVEGAFLKPGITLEHLDSYRLITSKGKVLNTIIHNRVYSVIYPMELYLMRLALAYCIDRRDIDINLGTLIVGNLVDLAQNKGEISSLVYPKTITAFCARSGVKISPATVDWAFTDTRFLLYKGYDHSKQGQQSGEEHEGYGPRYPPTKKRIVEEGSSGFVARDDEYFGTQAFMEQFYISRRELRDFMVDTKKFMADSRARWAKEDEKLEEEGNGGV